MTISSEVIYTVIGALAGVIVFMTGGFIYVYKKQESKLEEAERALREYMTEHLRLRQELEETYDKLNGRE